MSLLVLDKMSLKRLSKEVLSLLSINRSKLMILRRIISFYQNHLFNNRHCYKTWIQLAWLNSKRRNWRRKLKRIYMEIINNKILIEMKIVATIESINISKYRINKANHHSIVHKNMRMFKFNKHLQLNKIRWHSNCLS